MGDFGSAAVPELGKSVLIADDSQAIRWTLRKAFQQAGFNVCGEAVDGQDAVEKATQFAPDAIVLDFKMPRMNGIEAATLLRRKLPGIPIVLLTLYDVGPAISNAAGINVVCPKQDGITNLPAQVKKLLDPPPAITTLFLQKP